jgi:hypothetical protein
LVYSYFLFIFIDSNTFYGGTTKYLNGIQYLSAGKFIFTNNSYIPYPTNKIGYRPISYKIAPNACVTNLTEQTVIIERNNFNFPKTTSTD